MGEFIRIKKSIVTLYYRKEIDERKNKKIKKKYRLYDFDI